MEEDLGAEDSRPVYELNQLKRRGFQFPIDPADGIQDVRITSLKLSPIGSRDRVTFECDPKGNREAIYDLIEGTLDADRRPLSTLNVSSVVIRMQFERIEAEETRRTVLSFRLSYPDSCNLKDSPEELIAKKYLREWNLERD